ncbi:ORF6N domain-containing protein [Niabella agricola]|uniref:ORF6N domain-containing protein n=1 Tax=Niabella agricola TaxID=2891571 RepID=UPI001F1E19B4|nr:ORF6N domain-containing protein [Niabella agricola]
MYNVETRRLNEQVKRNGTVFQRILCLRSGKRVRQLDVAICDIKLLRQYAGRIRPASYSKKIRLSWESRILL